MSRYDGPVVDAHHHFWQPALGFQPWLRPGAAIEFRYGDYSALKRDYLPADLRRDAAEAGIHLVGSVSMETEWVDDDEVGEVVHTERYARADGLPSAIVAHATLHRPDVTATLAELAAHDLVRAVRHKPGQSADPARPAVTLLSDPAWRRGFAALAGHGLRFELQTAWWQFEEAHDLFRRHPEVPVTVNHAGLPADRSPEALAAWRRALRRLAELDHVNLKVSGIGVPGRRWTPALQRPVVETCVEVLGVERTMFASNFPVDSLTATYREVWGTFLDLTATWSPDEQEAVFHRTAATTYGLSLRDVDTPAPPGAA